MLSFMVAPAATVRATRAAAAAAAASAVVVVVEVVEVVVVLWWWWWWWWWTRLTYFRDRGEANASLWLRCPIPAPLTIVRRARSVGGVPVAEGGAVETESRLDQSGGRKAADVRK